MRTWHSIGLRCVSAIVDLTAFALYTFLPTWISSRLLSLTDHFAYHDRETTGFEGYYTRIQTADDKSTLAIIFSSVHDAHKPGSKSHFVHFSLTPSPSSTKKPIRVDCYPERMSYTDFGCSAEDGRRNFTLQGDTFALYSVARDSQFYWIAVPDPDHDDCSLIISARLTDQTPLHPTDPLRTPHQSVIRLSSILPLHWHIFSTASKADYMITRRRYCNEGGKERVSEEVVIEGCGIGHMEKNWGRGFPKGWLWSVSTTSAKFWVI